MMTFEQLLQNKKDAIRQRWLDDVLATYPEDSAAAYRRQKDPFANPVGRGLREGTRGIVEALFGGAEDQELRRHLDEIIRIRAVQQFSASQAVGFVFRLKEAIRVELGEALQDPGASCELAKLDRRIDRAALAAFDIFAKCREQVFELRVSEVKRRVSWVAEKLNQRGFDPDSASIGQERERPTAWK